MMLDKAIKTQEQIAKKMEGIAESLRLNGKQDDDIVHDFLALAGYYHQLAVWLKELKDRRNSVDQKN